MNPELGNREFETARLIAAKLEPLGFEVRTGVAKTGVVAVLRGGQPGPAVAVRADMDALPVQETTNLPFKSLNPGVMHACGHDVHSSVVLGTALVLNALKDSVKGTVTFLFQPSEEGPPEGEEGGADLMVREGALDDPPVRAVFGFHVWPENVGTVLFAPGNVTAAADTFVITIKGKSAHGARPHEGVDAVVIAAEIVTALQTVVSRASDPTDPAVLTVGTIHGGTRRNIIAERVVLEGTVRTLSETNRKKVRLLMESVVKNIAGMYGAGHEFEYKEGNPSVFNNPELAAAMTPTLTKLLGKDKARRMEAADDRRGLRLPGPEGPRLLLLPGRQEPGPADGGAPPQPQLQPGRAGHPPGDQDPQPSPARRPGDAERPRLRRARLLRTSPFPFLFLTAALVLGIAAASARARPGRSGLARWP